MSNNETDPHSPVSKRARVHKRLYRFDWWREELKSPRHVVAPMVDLSELAFRMQCRKYGADLCYTPMINSRCFATSAEYRRSNFFTHADDQPLIAQVAGDDPADVVAACKYLEGQVSGIDLNLGCPQGIARKGHYGAYLLDYPDVICGVTSAMTANLTVPVSCKIRLVSTPNRDDRLQKTSDLIRRLDATGIDLLTIHGRTKEEKGVFTQAADWAAIKQLAELYRSSFPIILNGGIETYADVQRALSEVGVDAVMSSEAVLEYPALFAPDVVVSQEALALEYLDLAAKYKHACPKVEVRCTRTHMFRFLHGQVQAAGNEDLRDRLARAPSVGQIRQIVLDLAEREVSNVVDNRAWYRRHRKHESIKVDAEHVVQPVEAVEAVEAVETPEL